MKKVNKVNSDKDNFKWVNWGEKQIKEIPQKVNKILKDYKTKVLRISEKELTFSNYIHLGEVMSAELRKLDGTLFGFVNLSTNEKVRNTGRKVELIISKTLGEFAYDEQLYKQFMSYFNNNFKKEKKNLTEEQIKIVVDSEKGYRKMGMHLDKKSKKKLLDIKNKVNKLAQEFDVLCVKNYEKGLWFSKDELRGIPEENFKSFKYEEKKKKYFINCSGRDDLGSDYPILKKYCEVAKTRQIATAYNEEAVGDANTKKLSQILAYRAEMVKMLGFKTWAELAVDDEMMNNSKDINKFLQDLIKKITPTATRYNLKLENVLKKKGEKLSTSSFAYAENLLRVDSLPVKEEEYKPYFELNKVMEVLFSIWEKYFDIETKKIPGQKVFHADTNTFKFYDKKSKKLLGYGVFDLHPRPGKYGHACVADIFKKYLDLDGTDNNSFTFLVCNFKKAISGNTFISLSDMNTFFHEAGHMLHMILMKNKYISTSSTSRDFVEIPSQFHENFIQDKKFVAENFKHFKTKQKMPKLLLDNMSKMTSRGEAKTWIRVSTQSLFDQEVHGKNILKYAKNFKTIDPTFEALWKKYAKIPTSKNRHYVSSWGHIVGGYDARYYSYVISRVYAQDFWAEFAKGGVKKGKMSEKYKKFLEAANTRPEKDLVKEYLGRKVNMKPFLDILKG